MVAGAEGAITGSAITKIIDRHVSRETATERTQIEGTPSRTRVDPALHKELAEFVTRMKAATRK